MTGPAARRPGVMSTFAMIWRRRALLAASVKVSLRQRYAGSTLGLLWLVMGPAILMSLYAAIYTIVFRIRPATLEIEVYILYIFAGLVPLINFSQGLMQGTVALSADREVLLNTVFPPEMVPLREAAASVVTLSVAMCIIFAVGIAIGQVALTWLLVPVVLALLLMFLAGITWILSLANLVLKDIQQMLVYVTIILLICSPIAYTPDMVPGTLRLLIYFNPLAYFIIAIQSLLVLGTLPEWPIVAGVFVFGLGSLVLGAHVFSRAKTVFFDHA